MARILSALLGMTLLLGVGCGGGSTAEADTPADPDPDGEVVVQIINQGFQDVDVFVYAGARGRLLGIAAGYKFSLFHVPWRHIAGSSRFRVAVDPIGKGGRFFTGYLVVGPGSLVTMTLMPNLSSSTVAVF